MKINWICRLGSCVRLFHEESRGMALGGKSSALSCPAFSQGTTGSFLGGSGAVKTAQIAVQVQVAKNQDSDCKCKNTNKTRSVGALFCGSWTLWGQKH